VQTDVARLGKQDGADAGVQVFDAGAAFAAARERIREVRPVADVVISDALSCR